MSNQGPVRNPVLVMRMMWVALTGALGLFTYIAFSTASLPGDPSQMWPAVDLQSADPTLQQTSTFTVIALLSLVASQILPRFLMKQQVKQRAGAGMGPAFVFVPFILRLALTESLALCGFLIAMTAGNSHKIVPFVALALLRNLMVYPTEGFARRWIENAGGKWDAEAQPAPLR